MTKQKQSCCGGNKKEAASSCCGQAAAETTESCSCGGPVKEITEFRSFCTSGSIKTPASKVPVVSPKLCITDLLGNFLVRFGFNRNNYAVKPGLYAVGSPDKKSPVLVSANYKMSFDALRKELTGLDAWILVIDSKGVNVWCAAGKGTFGTAELVNRIKNVKLDKIVEKREVIVPQLGAPGVEAHLVRKGSGFKVIFGPVEAWDIKAFLASGMKASEAQRSVTFGLFKRLEVTGIEFVTAIQIMLGVSALSVIAASFTKTGFSLAVGFTNASLFIAALFLAALSATVIPAALLPVLPGRMFSVKGAVAGLITSAIFVYFSHLSILTGISTVLLSASLASFVFMNYTGTSTFTSLTAVRKEIAVSVPVMIAAAVIGVALQIIDFVLKGAIIWN